ncbi:MAG: hypothetical protein ACFFBD_27770 [Candidatus Hodarchaeota archaeon]
MIIKRYVYLAGAVEIEDTWRMVATEKLAKIGFIAINPIRNEKLKSIGKHIKSETPDRLTVTRDLNDLNQIKLSGGLIIANLNTTKEGRRPCATLMEIFWAWTNQVPIIGVIGKSCEPILKYHPWLKVMVSAEVSSIEKAIDLIQEYFA